MNDKTVLITGATSGIGEIAARELVRQGFHVLIHGRSAERGQQTLDRIVAAVPGAKVELLLADLFVQAEVVRLAELVRQRTERLDVLLNNAGAYFDTFAETPDGIERTWALNHLAPFLLTRELEPLLKASAPARVVTVSSGAHNGPQIVWDDVQGRKRYSGWNAYQQSKLANILFSNELARRLAGSATSNALHPGFVATGFGHNNSGMMAWVLKLVQRLALSPEAGAQTSVYLASSPDVTAVTGGYFEKSRQKTPSPQARDADAARRLWGLSETMIKGG